MIVGKDTASGSFVLKSVPQLQPDESFNVKVPSHDTLTVLNGTFFDFDLWDVESRFWSVNYRNGCVSKIPFRGAKRTSYSVAARNESIFIFGGCKGDDVVPTCEKVDTATGEFTRLPDMSLARSRTSALNIPDIGIVVVGGWTANRLNFAEILVEDPSHKSGWRWMRLSPMLEGREEPGIASSMDAWWLLEGNTGMWRSLLNASP
ncbi:hypothetical protein EGR_10667 [Echinococcus granulosus]|uniref:Uncharacterized protein n=1 Tax=Echinococcus granulosus TaxID=6210 RepID=W6U0E1_ECHGR|nr:hypothetical protein EGR_10667 [Echinococcus granulosus]EUB54468.1 hypothetical protein EGR_10667 [Echinococcus granulosus]